ATEREAKALHEFDLTAFELHATDPHAARRAVDKLCTSLDWPRPAPDRGLPDFLFEHLTGFGPAERLVDVVAGTALRLPELQQCLFGNSVHAQRATASLIALATFARRQRDGRVLLPTRLHMFFRGLPALFACVDPRCTHARAPHRNGISGRLHTHARERCE